MTRVRAKWLNYDQKIKSNKKISNAIEIETKRIGG
jgi:hypothetical protein